MSVLLIIFITAVLVLFSGVNHQGKWLRWIGIMGLFIALFVSFYPEHLFWERYQRMFLFTEISAIFTRISLCITLLIFLLGDFALYRHRNHQSEIYALMLFSLCGGLILLGFQNLIILFLGIEILSIPLYVLAGSDKTNSKSIEASVKYFLIGAFATGFLLLGIAFIYGVFGTLDWQKILLLIEIHQRNDLLKIGILLMLGALGFKVALVPFHFWSPDVYQGSSSLITLFMASVVKIAGFFTFFKFFSVFSVPLEVLYFFTAISLIIPSVLGLIQLDTKRILAYSSIANIGYLMLIFFGDNTNNYSVLAFYLWAYSVAIVGVFLGLIIVEKFSQNTHIDNFNGLAKSQPLLAVMMSISLFSLAGIPFTAGFIGKLHLFLNAFSEIPFLVLIAVLASVLSVVYYLKLIIAMFFYKGLYENNWQRVPLVYNILAVFISFILVILGVFPNLWEMVVNN